MGNECDRPSRARRLSQWKEKFYALVKELLNTFIPFNLHRPYDSCVGWRAI